MSKTMTMMKNTTVDEATENPRLVEAFGVNVPVMITPRLVAPSSSSGVS